jgi:hypothetical protein
MGTTTPPNRDKTFAEADRDHTGNAVNARTDEMDRKLDKQAKTLRRDIADKSDDGQTTE